MRKNKWMSLALTTMVATMGIGLAACGSSADTAPADSDESATVAGANRESSGDKVELIFMGWEASPLETQAVKDGIAAFEAQYPNITVSYTPGLAGSEYNAKILSSAAAGALPDVMFVSAESYRQIAGAGALMELTDKFDENYSFDDFIESSRTIMDIDGHIFGISSCTVSPIVYYNKDVFDAAGVPACFHLFQLSG